jgi:hypothetical protein
VFGSQALETAIGMSLLFLVLASLASAIAEGYSRLLGKRAKDLEATVCRMLDGPGASPGGRPPLFTAFRGTSVYLAAQLASRRSHGALRQGERSLAQVRPTYLSAKAFADAVTEVLRTQPGRLVAGSPLSKRVAELTSEGHNDLLHVKAGLESWFDETMLQLSNAYKRWVTIVLFVIGLGLAAAGNISTFDVAQNLWRQPATRQAVVDAANTIAARRAGEQSPSQVATSVQDVEALGLPVGWSSHPTSLWPWLARLLGWLVTGLLVMLGAPFWFDSLSRLVSLRTTGAKPPRAADDPTSASARRAEGADVDATFPVLPQLELARAG